MYDLGMYQDDWNNWIMPQPYDGVSESLTSLRNSMYGISTMGLRISDFPDSFKNNRIINEAINF